MKKPVVAVLKTTPDTVVEDYARLMEMAGYKDHLQTQKTTILKDNISWHMFMPGANTTPWQLEGVIKKLRATPGYEDLVVVENRTVVTNAPRGEKNNRWSALFRFFEVPVRYNFNPRHMSWIPFEPKARMRVLHKIFPEGIRIPDFFLGKNIVHLPTCKCHIYTTTTGAMKNAFGGLLDTKRHYTHSWIHETLVDLLAIQKEIHAGLFAVADGTTMGNGPGPRTLIPVRGDLIFASADMVAIDAVMAKVMGFDPMSIDYIRLAHEDGLGVGRIEEIDIVGEDIGRYDFKFSVGDNFASMVGDQIWFGPLKTAQEFLCHTPIVYGLILASSIYHDYYWYPFKAKTIVDEYMASPWGRLFDTYG